MFTRIAHNWTLKLTALVLSIALWSHVRGQVNPWETATFRARLQTEAPKGFLLQESSALPKSVVVTLRGPRLMLRALKGPAPASPLATSEEATPLSASQLRAVLDFSDPRKGTQSVPIKVISEIEDVEVVGSKPSEVVVALDIAESRSFPVKAQIAGMEELTILNVEISRKQATATAPSKLLDRVAGLRVRVPRGEMVAGVLRLNELPLEAIDADGDPIRGVSIEPNEVSVTIKAREKQIEKSVPLVSRIEGEPDSDYEIGIVTIEPPRLTIRGLGRILEKIESLPVAVDVKDATGTFSRRVRVQLPDDVETLSSNRVLVRVEIKARSELVPQSTPATPLVAPRPTNTPQSP